MKSVLFNSFISCWVITRAFVFSMCRGICSCRLFLRKVALKCLPLNCFRCALPRLAAYREPTAKHEASHNSCTNAVSPPRAHPMHLLHSSSNDQQASILMMMLTHPLWQIQERRANENNRRPAAASPSSSHPIPDSSRPQVVRVVEEHHVHSPQDSTGIASKFALLSPVISHES